MKSSHQLDQWRQSYVAPYGITQSSGSYLFYSWWHHQMETSSALLVLCAVNSPVTGEFPSQRPVTRSFDFAPWINGWVNNREAGDLRRHRAHYDVIVMLMMHHLQENSLNMIKLETITWVSSADNFHWPIPLAPLSATDVVRADLSVGLHPPTSDAFVWFIMS